MKKSLLAIAMVCGMSATYAQDLTSKKGEPILPETGDWAIAFDAVPFLNYAGRMLSNAGATSPNATWTDSNTMTIMGKMFKDEKTAYRAMVRIGYGTDTYKGMVGANGATPPTFPALPQQVEDKAKVSSHAIVLGAGMEMRRGKTRLQGFYGADAMLIKAGTKYSYEYGNAMDATYTNPASTNFQGQTGQSNLNVGSYVGRATEIKTGSMFGFGVRGFIGAEYFIFAKMSIGAEYGWGLGISKSGKGEITYQANNGGNPSDITEETQGSSNWGFDTDISKWWSPFGSSNGNLFLALHF